MILQKENENLSSALLRWSLDFNENLELDRKDIKTIENYMNTINKFIDYVTFNPKIDDDNKITDIDDRFIKRFFNWRDEEHNHKTGKNLKNSTKTNDKKILIIFFSYIEDENDDRLDLNIKWKKIRFAREINEKTYFQPELVRAFLDYLENYIKKEKTEFSYMLSFCFKLALYGGLRATEICNLELKSFGTAYTNKDTKTKLIPLTIKGKSKTLYTNPIPYNYIKKELNYFSKIKQINEKLFLTKTSLPLNRTHLYRYFEKISNELNLGKKGVHIIRRTFATNLSKAGVDVVYIQNLMRHKDIKTTTIYIARSQDMMDKAVSKL